MSAKILKEFIAKGGQDKDFKGLKEFAKTKENRR